MIIFPEYEHDVGPQMERTVATYDSIYWTKLVLAPFSWQGFLNWWIARRWIVPKDLKKMRLEIHRGVSM